MSTKSTNQEQLETAVELRRQIEGLAITFMLGDVGGAQGTGEPLGTLAATLAGIRQQAEEVGWAEIARVCAELAETLAAKDPNEQALEAGVTRLQQALEVEARQASTTTAAPPPDHGPEAPAPQTLSVAQDPELISDFILESREHLSSIEAQLLTLEQDPQNSEAMNSVFRSFHTIKGLAGFLELPQIQAVSHEVETALDLARNWKLAITPAVIDVVLADADYLIHEIGRVESMLGKDVPAASADNRSLLERVRRLIGREPAEEASADPGPAPEEVSEAAPPSNVDQAAEASGPAERSAPAAPPPAEVKDGKRQAGAVKVDTGKLDYLVDMVGELVIAQSMVRHDRDLAGLNNPRLLRNLSQLARITDEVQKTAMAIRMVPIGQLFQRMSRLVRDLSRKAGKQAELDISGEDTELDRTIVEELGDPLMHMVRNAADHGIEAPEGRLAAGKNPIARIGLKACHQAGHIQIEVSDDGRGLNKQKILEKARQKGLIQNGDHLADSEIFNLIFEPGFSTAEQVTDVSGRGVGMDVVRRNIQKLRGRVEIQSVSGKGTKFFLKLPLTLAIIDGLVVGVGKERFIVPIFAVQEMFRPTPEMISKVQDRAEMVLVRGALLPLLRLHGRFGVRPRSEDLCESLLIVAEAGGKRFCLVVDEFIGKQEVVIKSLGEGLKNTPGVAGGAILGDGRVGLILDMDGLHGGRANG